MWSLNEKRCLKCASCVGVCPQGALELDDKIINDQSKCTLCGICVKACPLGIIKVNE